MCNGAFLVRLETPLEAEFRVYVRSLLDSRSLVSAGLGRRELSQPEGKSKRNLKMCLQLSQFC